MIDPREVPEDELAAHATGAISPRLRDRFDLLARRAAARYKRRCWWADYDDLRQGAWEAAVMAVRSWDPLYGSVLEAYVWRAMVQWLRGQLWRASTPVSVHWHSLREAEGHRRVSFQTPVDEEPGKRRQTTAHYHAEKRQKTVEDAVSEARHRDVADVVSDLRREARVRAIVMEHARAVGAEADGERLLRGEPPSDPRARAWQALRARLRESRVLYACWRDLVD